MILLDYMRVRWKINAYTYGMEGFGKKENGNNC